MSVVLRTRTTTLLPRRQSANLKKSSFDRNQVKDRLAKLVSLWLPHVLIPTACLNSRLCFSDLSSLDLWTKRNQFTHEQLSLSDYHLILDRHEHRSTSHAYSEKSKNSSGLVPNTPSLQLGDIVYLVSDKDKSRVRDTSYKVKLSKYLLCLSAPPDMDDEPTSLLAYEPNKSGQRTRWTCLSTAIKFSKFLKFCLVSLRFLSSFLFHNGCACYTR